MHEPVPVTLLVGTVLGLLLGALDGLMLMVIDDQGDGRCFYGKIPRCQKSRLTETTRIDTVTVSSYGQT